MIFLFLVNINRCTFREGDAIGRVERFQINSPITDARLHGYDSTQEFTMLARKERWHRQFIPPFLLAQVAHSPDAIIVGFKAKPRLHHIANTEPFALTSEEALRALQLPPEHHEAFLGILNLNHNFKIDFDQMTLTF